MSAIRVYANSVYFPEYKHHPSAGFGNKIFDIGRYIIDNTITDLVFRCITDIYHQVVTGKTPPEQRLEIYLL